MHVLLKGHYLINGLGCFKDEEDGHSSDEDLFAKTCEVGHETRALRNSENDENDHQPERNAGTPLQVGNMCDMSKLATGFV